MSPEEKEIVREALDALKNFHSEHMPRLGHKFGNAFLFDLWHEKRAKLEELIK